MTGCVPLAILFEKNATMRAIGKDVNRIKVDIDMFGRELEERKRARMAEQGSLVATDGHL